MQCGGGSGAGGPGGGGSGGRAVAAAAVPAGGWVGAGAGGIEPLSRSVFVRRLPPTVTLEDLVNEVGVYGPIESFRIDYERHEAYVNFVDGAHAATLLDEKPTISPSRGSVGMRWKRQLR